MAFEKRHSTSTFVIKVLWTLFLVFQECNLVICDGLEDDSLKSAWEAIERRQRDLELQENDYFGQPENIGYGFQKTLGFFDNNGPASALGSFDSGPKTEADLQNLLLPYDDPDFDATAVDKRKTNFRERMAAARKNQNDRYLVSQRDADEDDFDGGVEYLQLLKNLWGKYRQSRPDELTVEDLTDEQVEDLLNALFDKEDEEDGSYESVPVRGRKNYRVFDALGRKSKRYPSFGEGFYGKRNQIAYRPGPENEFLYSLKYVNPELNREAVESLKDGSEFLGDERDVDVARVLAGGRRREGDVGYEDEGWLPGPVDWLGRNEKRDPIPRASRQHGRVRLPVKRSSVRVRKEAEKASKEVKSSFEGTTAAPSKKTTKKPTEALKKNATKPEVTKHREVKKLVRRSDKYAKEALPNSEIAEIFGGERGKSKKAIDWSQYFGLDKRSGWLKNDHLRLAEQHLVAPKRKRFDDMPFDTRHFSQKRFPTDIDSNIDRVEDRIGDIEERIIDDAVKYTGAHSGGEGENLGQVRSKVMQRLEAAYSLEKMKNALEEFKNLIKPGKYSEVAGKTSTETPKTESRTTVPKESSNLEKPLAEKKPAGEASKRTATKKEGVKAIFGQGPSDSAEFLSDSFSSDRQQYENEGCSVLEGILHNCLRVEEMGGRFAELLVPLCSLQQICYYCGAEIGFSKMSTCDAVYLSEARNICQGDGDCLISARNSMLALQDLYEQDLFGGNGRRMPPDSCLANPCIQRYFLNAPGAIYPLEMQK